MCASLSVITLGDFEDLIDRAGGFWVKVLQFCAGSVGVNKKDKL